MDKQEKPFPPLAQEADEALSTLDNELLEGVTGAGLGNTITNAVKKCVACGKLPPLEEGEEYMRSPSGRILSRTEAKEVWKGTFSSPEEAGSSPWHVYGKDVYGKVVGVKYPMSPLPTK
jgi:hypothetical protein